MFDARFTDEEMYPQYSKFSLTSELGDLSKSVIQLLKDQCEETKSKSVIDLINDHLDTRLFFQPGKDATLHEALKKNPTLIKLLDIHVTQIEQCKTADKIYEKVTAVVNTFFDPIKNTGHWKEYWKKQSRKTRLLDTSWHENLVAGCFLFVLISIWENSQVKISGLTTARETSELMKVVNLVLCNPSLRAFKAALQKELVNSIKNLHRKGVEINKVYETINSVRKTLYFQLHPKPEALLVSELILILEPLQVVIGDIQKVILECPVLMPPTVYKKPPPLQLSAIVPVKLRTSGSPERGGNPPREANSMPEKKQTPRRSAGRGRTSSGTKDISETRSEVPIIQVPPPATAHQTLNFFQRQPETDSDKYEPPAPQ